MFEGCVCKIQQGDTKYGEGKKYIKGCEIGPWENLRRWIEIRNRKF